jgi:hypothetical protein
MKEPFPSFPGAEETGVLPILRAIGPPPNIREFDMIGETLSFKMTFQDLGSTGTEPQIDIDGY